MSDPPDSSKSVPQIRTGVAKILVLGLILWIIGSIVYMFINSAGRDPTPTVYHHPDGTFSLNRKNGPSITPDDVYKCLKGYTTFGRVRLVSNPLTRLADWNPILYKGGDAGAGRYQIEAGDMSYSFTLPNSDGYFADVFNPVATIISLVDMAEPPLDVYPASDVVILVGPTTTCYEALEAALKHSGIGISITIMSEADISDARNSDLAWVVLHHRKDDYGNSCGTFVRRRSGFWNRHIQPTIDRFGSVF